MILTILGTVMKPVCAFGASGIAKSAIDTLARPETMTGITKICYGPGKWALGAAAGYAAMDAVDRKVANTRKFVKNVNDWSIGAKEKELEDLKKKLEKIQQEEAAKANETKLSTK